MGRGFVPEVLDEVGQLEVEREGDAVGELLEALQLLDVPATYGRVRARVNACARFMGSHAVGALLEALQLLDVLEALEVQSACNQ